MNEQDPILTHISARRERERNARTNISNPIQSYQTGEGERKADRQTSVIVSNLSLQKRRHKQSSGEKEQQNQKRKASEAYRDVREDVPPTWHTPTCTHTHNTRQTKEEGSGREREGDGEEKQERAFMDGAFDLIGSSGRAPQEGSWSHWIGRRRGPAPLTTHRTSNQNSRQ